MGAVATQAFADTLVDVGGHRLHVEIRRGRPDLLVLFEAGGAADATSWGEVPSALAGRTDVTIVTYDRAGLGQSELGPETMTPYQEIRDIHAGLAALGLRGRTVVVGHSYGGLLALAHADLYPDAVVGLVLVDPMNPAFVAEQTALLRSTVPDIAEPATDRERAVLRMARTLEPLAARLRPLEPELTIPIALITAGLPWWGAPEPDSVWRRSHEAIAAGSDDRRLIVAEGSQHDIPGTAPGLVVSTILEMVQRVTDSPAAAARPGEGRPTGGS